jgi:hypothetical protein
MIYDYLFYKGYQLAKRLKNWEDAPILFSTMCIGVCFIMNFASILFLIEGLSKNYYQFSHFMSGLNEFKYLSGCILGILIWWYYSCKGRWQKIVTKYENKEKQRGKSINPIIVLIAAYFLSAVLGTLTAMYRNGDGIFG